MDKSPESPPIDRPTDLVTAGKHKEAIACLEQVETMPAEERKATLRALRTLADGEPDALGPLVPALTPFLTDDERSIRLTTAKLLVTLAEADPDAVVPIRLSLSDRLADDDEFYYVRARSAEALGYVALGYPDEVASPETLADLRIGLSFDEPEVKEKLAKALEYVALGNPDRLVHQVSSLAEHLDDENELVRYHLCTVLVIVGCESPEKLVAVTGELGARLDDENAYVRGRAAEAIGLLGRSDTAEVSLPREALERLAAAEEAFVAERARFAIGECSTVDVSDDRPIDVGTVGGIRRTTNEVVDDITSPDSDRECPHCGLELPEGGGADVPAVWRTVLIYTVLGSPKIRKRYIFLG